jgi:predicted nuclease with TOPRIM domain
MAQVRKILQEMAMCEKEMEKCQNLLDQFKSENGNTVEEFRQKWTGHWERLDEDHQQLLEGWFRVKVNNLEYDLNMITKEYNNRYQQIQKHKAIMNGAVTQVL